MMNSFKVNPGSLFLKFLQKLHPKMRRRELHKFQNALCSPITGRMEAKTLTFRKPQECLGKKKKKKTKPQLCKKI